jgi:death-on-curing protein
MRIWRWLSEDVIFAAHDMQIAQHGGLDGVKDIDAVRSALARPQQLAAYGEPPPDIFDLAAAYAFGLVKNHGFADGNKRIAWIAARLFLLDNGQQIQFLPAQAIQQVLSLASSELSEAAFSQWLRNL